MLVKVLFFGVLKDMVGKAEESLEVAPGTTLGGLFASYSERYETLQGKRPSILFARNREFAPADTALCDQDEVAFLPPVSGGSGGDGHIFEIVRQPIDSRGLVERLQRPEDGAVVVFEGVVRNNTKGRPTDTFGVRVLRRNGARADGEDWPGDRVAIRRGASRYGTPARPLGDWRGERGGSSNGAASQTGV